MAPQLLRRYLLGSLTEPEQVQVEEEIFTDDANLILVDDMEDELIIDYLSQQLSGEERRQFEEHFLDSPRRRERLEVTRLLLQPRPRMAVSWMRAAAAVVLVAGLGWMIYRDAERGRTIASLEKEIETLRRPQIEVIPFLLRSGSTRDPGRPAWLRVPPGERLIRLDLERPATAGFSRFRIRVETVDGKQVWSEEGPAASIPSSLLPPNDYVLTLLGAGAGGVFEEMADYSFRVVRP